jgi:hypothetical protein
MHGGTGAHAAGGACDESTSGGQLLGMLFDDPASAFNGSGHFADINSNLLSNSDGPEVWYTDAVGRKGRTTPFAGSDPPAAPQDGQPDRVQRGWAGGWEPQLLGRRGARAELRQRLGYACRSWQRMSRMPPGVIRIRVNTWVILTER